MSGNLVNLICQNQCYSMASIKFLLKSDSNPSGIYVRITDGKPVDVMAKTKFSINPSDWSAAFERPKNLKEDYFKNLNSELTGLKADILKHYNNSRGIVTINTRWLKEFLNPSQSTTLPTGLVKYFDVYIDSKRNLVKPNSIKKFNVIKHKLEKYERETRSTLKVSDVNRDFQVRFETFCIKHNYSHNTITMELRFIKTVCRHAQRNGLKIHDQLEHIENKYVAVDNIYLTPHDIQKIKDTEGLSESLSNVRDWLLISCYCGQRISDFLRFSKDMLREETNRAGQPILLIEFEQVKTGKIMTLPLHKEIGAILKMYGGEFPPAISDQKYNEYIKLVCQAAKINDRVQGSKKVETAPKSKIFRKETGIYEKWELVTSHIGRRSFATNFYGIIPTSLLIAATGHSTEQMFLKYIGKSSSDRAKELAEYF